ncbi:15430_t:CDS:2 [Entrophospora sp. SA101]|nr:15430_t:CDS:2 [Entrophospora sp. SA101]
MTNIKIFISVARIKYVGKINETTGDSTTTTSSIIEENTQNVAKQLTNSKLIEFKKIKNKTGVIYLSRIPPFMKPAKIKHLLSRYGEIGRVYLAPEDAKIHARRKKYGGNKKKNYAEGWVEFLDKKDAKNVANILNTQPIGGNRRNHYHDDLWNIKYLSKFKWSNLTDQIAYENAARVQRLTAEISQSRRENKDYIAKVEKAKKIRNIIRSKEKSSLNNNKNPPV